MTKVTIQFSDFITDDLEAFVVLCVLLNLLYYVIRTPVSNLHKQQISWKND